MNHDKSMELGVAYFQIHWSFDVQVWNDRIFEGPAAVAWPSRGGFSRGFNMV